MPTSISGGEEQVASSIGSCLIVFGTVRAVSPYGVMRSLHPNSPVYLDDHIMTGRDGMVSIILNDDINTKIDLGRMSDFHLTSDIFEDFTSGELTNAETEVAQIQEGLLTGEIDPTIALEAPAAGFFTNTLSGSGGGIHWARFDLTGRQVTPDSGAETRWYTYEELNLEPTILYGEESEIFTADVAVEQALDSPEPRVISAAAGTVSNSITASDTYQGPQNAILVDEAGNYLEADMALSDISQFGTLSIEPLAAYVGPGGQVYENGEPMLLSGNEVYWQMNDDGYWSAVVRRPVQNNDTGEQGGHDDHDEEKEYIKEFDQDDGFKVTVTAIDHNKNGDPVDGWVHGNGQGTGVGNPFINMDSSGSEVLKFSFVYTGEETLTLDHLKLGIDHLDGAKGHSSFPEMAEWKLYDESGRSLTGQFEGSGQGSSNGSDQVGIIEIPDEFSGFTSTLYLEMSFISPSEPDDSGEVCGQGYRISSIDGIGVDGKSLFSALLKKSEEGHSDGTDDHSHEETTVVQVTSEGEQTYEEVVLFTVYPEMDSMGMYTGSYIVDQDNEFHDKTFNISLTGAKGGPQLEKNFTDGEVNVKITATDYDHHTDEMTSGKVHANGQGMGVSNPFINMDSAGSEVLHFVFTNSEGEFLDMQQVSLGIDHLSGGHGSQHSEPEQAQWVAFTIDEDGMKSEIASGVFDGEGQGSGWKSDQELVIKVCNEDGTPQYFNGLDMSFIAPEAGDNHESVDAAGDSGSEGEEEVCGQGYRISSIEGIFDPGDHSFDFAVIGTEGENSSSVATLHVTFDGDGVVAGTIADEVIAGSTGDDYLDGGGGDDIILAGEGNDVLIGNSGNDILIGEDGEDILAGGQGSDIITGDEMITPDNSADTFATSEVNSGEVTDFDMSEGDSSLMDPLDSLVAAVVVV